MLSVRSQTQKTTYSVSISMKFWKTQITEIVVGQWLLGTENGRRQLTAEGHQGNILM